MAKVLLIQREDLITFTAMNGNVDEDKFIQYIGIAQDMHLQKYLGTDLLVKLQNDISASTLAGNYLTLVTDWVKPVLIHWAMYEIIPRLAVRVGNGGLFRHEPENGSPLTSEEVQELRMGEKDLAIYYTERMIDYLCANSSLFAEYSTNTNEDVDPSTATNYSGWALN